MSPISFELLNESSENPEGWEDGLCDCSDGPYAKLEIDCGDIILTCGTCGKSLLSLDDMGSVYMDSIHVDVECIQEHDHNWDTLGCDCNFYWELKTKVPKNE